MTGSTGAQNVRSDIFGEGGNDYIDADSNANDLLDGGDGNDELIAARGNDTLIGGAGDDRLYSSNGAALLVTGEGNDTVTVYGGDDTIRFVADDALSFSATVVSLFSAEDGDRIELISGTIDDFDDLVANHVTELDGSVQIVHDSYTILLEGISLAELADPSNGYADSILF